MTSRLESLVAMFKTNFRFFYNDDNSIGVALFKISCLADFAPLLRLRFPFANRRWKRSSPASPLNRPSQQVFELQLIDHVVIGSPAPGAEQLLQLE